jgi:hypothetical protein
MRMLSIRRFLAPALQNTSVVSSDLFATGDRGDGVSYRTFLDTTGRRWEVWLVTPAAAERRKADRRAASAARPGEGGFPDRRLTPERRRNPFRRSIEVASEYSQGWLCFESEGEKRRLAPVPDGWDESGPDRLGTWLQAAKRVVKCGP